MLAYEWYSYIFPFGMARFLFFPPVRCMHLLPLYPSPAPEKWRPSRSTMRQLRSAMNAKESWVANSSSNKKPGFISLGEQLLDYIEGGPKLRKWYGAPDQLPRDAIVGDEDTNGEPEQEDLPEVRDAVLVTDGDSEIGQLVILSLIIKRARTKAIVKDTKAAMGAFGLYIEPIAGAVTDKASVKTALKGVRAIICTTEMGALAEIEILKGIEHIIYLSQKDGGCKEPCMAKGPLRCVYRWTCMHLSSSGIQAFINSKAKRLAEEDEAAVISSGIPYTIIRSGLLQDKPGAQRGFSFKEGCAANGTLSKEDAAAICVEALGVPLRQGLIFEVVNGEEKVQNWKDLFISLAEGGSKFR